MRSTLLRFVEVLSLRAVPGVVTLLVVVLLGRWLGSAHYGRYSTDVAAVGLIASLGFGPFTFAIISQHARFEAAGRIAAFESTVVTTSLMIGLALAAISGLLAAIGLPGLHWLAPAAALGIYGLVQELHHARLKFWSFGAASLVQSLTFVGLAWFLVRPAPTVDAALYAFAGSYGLAAILSLALSRFPAILAPDKSVLRDLLRIGGPYSFSILAENGLYLGFRLVFMLFGTAHQLGVFSFCVDLAQRLVGSLINVAGFAFVPKAFKDHANGRSGSFRRTLGRGSVMAAALSTAAAGAVIAAWAAGWIGALRTDTFHPVVFAVIAAAVIVNRTRKMAVDPFALRANRPGWIAISYIVTAPVSFIAAAAALQFRAPFGAEVLYLLSYLAAAALTAWLVLRGKVSHVPAAETPA